MEEILVTVIAISYNHEKYIRQTLDSILSQKTSFKFEIIVNDDASTDNSQNIIREYYESYPDVIVMNLHKENYGHHGKDGYPELVELARGKYIAFCECDDYWCDDNKLQKQYDILEANSQYSMCVHNTNIFNCRDNTIELLNKNDKDNCIMGVDRILNWGEEFIFHMSSMFLRKECLGKLHNFYYVAKGFSDLPFALSFALDGDIFYINKIMSVYRMYHNNSWSQKHYYQLEFRYNHYLNLIDMYKAFDEETDKKYHHKVKEIIRTQKRYAIDTKKKGKLDFSALDYFKWFFIHCDNKFRKMMRFVCLTK